MRKWIKYFLASEKQGRVWEDKSTTAEDHERDMGGYLPDLSYGNKEDFFAKWYFNYHKGRIRTYNNFLVNHLDKKKKILSLASGRCAGELFLVDKGYSVTCSDLKELRMHGETRRLFPSFKFFTFNIFEPPLMEKYDAITAFSLIYLFDRNELKLFFENVASSLNDLGSLIMDGGSAPDNLGTLFIDEVVVRCETFLNYLALNILGKRNFWVAKHQGFRWTDNEIVAVAREAGLELIATENNDFLSEFERSRLFRFLIKKSALAEKIFSIIGRKIPYIRLFNFKLIQKKPLDKPSVSR